MGLLTKAATTIARGLGLTSPRLNAFFAGAPTYSGRSVNAESALTLDSFWACVRLISSTIATLPLEMFEADAQSVDRVDPDHPLQYILRGQPNVEMTAVEFWTAVVACKLIWGNAYAQIVRGAGGRVVALLPMRSDRVQVVWNYDGTRTYHYNWLNVSITLPEDEVLHIKGFSLDGLTGLSVIGYARHSLGNALAAEESAGSLFRNAMRPSGYMKAPAYLTDPQREQAKAIIERFSGAENTGKVPLLEGGWSFEKLEIPPEDAQLLETRGFSVETVCRWFGVAPVMIGHMSKSTAWGSGLEQMNLWFLTYALRPHLKVIEQAISTNLIAPADRIRVYAKFNVDALLRADSKGRAELFRTYVTNGIMTVNEVRRQEGLPPHPDGDQLVMQSAMVPINKLGEIASLPHLKPVAPGASEVEGATQQGDHSNDQA